MAVGRLAGESSQGDNAVAVGESAGLLGQAENSVAIGKSAGSQRTSDSSVYIGRNVCLDGANGGPTPFRNVIVIAANSDGTVGTNPTADDQITLKAGGAGGASLVATSAGLSINGGAPMTSTAVSTLEAAIRSLEARLAAQGAQLAALRASFDAL